MAAGASDGVAKLDDRFYPGVESNWDDELLRDLVLTELRPNHLLLDVGAGAGIVEAMDFKGLAREVHGTVLFQIPVPQIEHAFNCFWRALFSEIALASQGKRKGRNKEKCSETFGSYHGILDTGIPLFLDTPSLEAAPRRLLEGLEMNEDVGKHLGALEVNRLKHRP